MQKTVKLSRLRPVLPEETYQALCSDDLPEAAFLEAEVKRSSVAAEIKGLAEGERAVELYISTRDVDRDNEILDPRGAVLSQFKLAPQVLWGHDYSLPPIARASDIRVDDYGIRAKAVFAETERAEEIWQLVKGGFLSTASVGFIPLNRVWKDNPDWRSVVDHYRDLWGVDIERAGAQVVTTKWILLEFSMVPVPANPHALVTAIAKGLTISAALRKQLGLDDDDTPGEVDVEQVEVLEATPDAVEAGSDADTLDVALVLTSPVVAQWTPLPPEPEPPAPRPIPDPASTIIVAPVKAARPVIVRMVQPAPTIEDLMARVSRETLDQLRGRV